MYKTNDEEAVPLKNKENVEASMTYLTPDTAKARKVLTGRPFALTGKAQQVLTGESAGVEERRPSSTLSMYYLLEDTSE